MLFCFLFLVVSARAINIAWKDSFPKCRVGCKTLLLTNSG